MFFGKKIERSLDTLKYIADKREGSSKEERTEFREEEEKLEAKDIPAIILSAFAVFGPILLIMIVAAFLLTI